MLGYSYTINGNYEQSRNYEHFETVSAIQKVVFYGDCDFNGSSSVLGVGRYDMGAMGIANDMISSIKIPSGLSVTLFENAGFSGRSIKFTNDVPCLVGQVSNGLDFNDQTSSIIIELLPTPPPKTIGNYNYSGCYADDSARALPTRITGVHTMESCIAAVGDKYDMIGLQNNNECWAGSKFDTTRYPAKPDNDNSCKYNTPGPWTNIVYEKFELQPQGVTFYTDHNFTENGFTLSTGAFNFNTLMSGKYKFTNDSISSIKIPSGYSVTIYKDDIGSENITFTSDVSLKGSSFDKQTSAIEVIKQLIQSEPIKLFQPESLKPSQPEPTKPLQTQGNVSKPPVYLSSDLNIDNSSVCFTSNVSDMNGNKKQVTNCINSDWINMINSKLR
jgi:hypothetical protein